MPHVCRFYQTSVQASILIATHKTEFIDKYNDLGHFEQYCQVRLSLPSQAELGSKDRPNIVGQSFSLAHSFLQQYSLPPFPFLTDASPQWGGQCDTETLEHFQVFSHLQRWLTHANGPADTRQCFCDLPSKSHQAKI